MSDQPDRETPHLKRDPEALAALTEKLAAFGYVGTFWHVEDVQEERPYLSDAQAMAAMRHAGQNGGSNMAWADIMASADALFADPALAPWGRHGEIVQRAVETLAQGPLGEIGDLDRRADRDELMRAAMSEQLDPAEIQRLVQAVFDEQMSEPVQQEAEPAPEPRGADYGDENGWPF